MWLKIFIVILRQIRLNEKSANIAWIFKVKHETEEF